MSSLSKFFEKRREKRAENRQTSSLTNIAAKVDEIVARLLAGNRDDMRAKLRALGLRPLPTQLSTMAATAKMRALDKTVQDIVDNTSNALNESRKQMGLEPLPTGMRPVARPGPSTRDINVLIEEFSDEINALAKKPDRALGEAADAVISKWTAKLTSP